MIPRRGGPCIHSSPRRDITAAVLGVRNLLSLAAHAGPSGFLAEDRGRLAFGYDRICRLLAPSGTGGEKLSDEKEDHDQLESVACPQLCGIERPVMRLGGWDERLQTGKTHEQSHSQPRLSRLEPAELP